MERPGVELATSLRPNHYTIHQKGNLGCTDNCKQAELLHVTKIKEYQICCHQVCSMSQTPNKWNICVGRGEEGKGWRLSEEQGGANLLHGFRGIDALV